MRWCLVYSGLAHETNDAIIPLRPSGDVGGDAKGDQLGDGVVDDASTKSG